jgi:phosphoribosyl 1,2-cyclic phosphodiesterase
MKIHIIGSSSKGNSYILEGKTSALIIEAGCPSKDVKKTLKFDLSKIAGCIVSHSHGDHSKYLNEILNMGIDCYTSEETLRELKLKPKRLSFILEHNHQKLIGEFKVLPFSLKHDVACLGFLIYHPECGNVVFITDTHYCSYVFHDIYQYIIEVNYDENILDELFIAGKINSVVRERVLRSHMSLQTAKKMLQANNLSKINNIVLIHLSDGNSNAHQFKKEIEDLTGKTVTIADSGLSIDFNIEPF